MQVLERNNISAAKAYNQLLGACELMSLSDTRVREIRNGCKASVETEMKANRQKVVDKKHELEDVQEKLFFVEEKWIKNEITRGTYHRWYSTYNHTILNLKGAIERLSNDQGRALKYSKRTLACWGT